MKRHRILLIELGVLLVCGFAIYQYLATLGFVVTAQSTRGRISEIHKQWQCHRDQETQREHCAWRYSPLFTFLDLHERQHTIRSGIRTGDSQLYRVGDQVEVLFSARDPDNAKINRFSDVWFRPLFFSIWSLVVAIAYRLWSAKQAPDTRRSWLTSLTTGTVLLPLIILISAALL